jgi:hypothetical protein
MRVATVRWFAIGLPLLTGAVGAGCLGQADRTYYDDLVDGGGTDGTTLVDASVGVDSSTGGDDGGVTMTDDGPPGPGDDAADAGGDEDADLLDAGADAPIVVIEAGCGSLATVGNCGACGAACDTAHSVPAACASGVCSYTSCTPGFGDCDASAGNFNGCETQLDTTVNCHACGATCDTTHSTGAACGASGCTYVGCAAGWSMCNTAAPNAAGCACNTPGCCGTSCNTTHNNGLGNDFYDCLALGTVDASAQAFKACTASKDGSAQCSGGWTCNGSTTQYVCDAPSVASKGTCSRCWAYAGAQTGTVQDCSCPGLVIGNWN